MQKYCLLFFLFFAPILLQAQQRSKVVLRESALADIDTRTQITRAQKPVFEHDGAILTCDSARFWTALNYFEAFGHVHINQGDTIHIYADHLNYDGNAKMAHLLYNVRMQDRNSTLTTDIFDYNMATRVGTYIEKGKIVNKEATITSKKGFYFANSKDAYFRYNVVVITDQVSIHSDTLRYNTATDETYFYGPTNIKGKDDNLYTENGQYNTKTEKAFFGLNNLYTKDTQTLKGDSLYYNGKLGYGRAVKNIRFTDSRDKLLLRGNLGEYYKNDERVVVTLNAYVGLGTSDSVMVNNVRVPDTLWLGADTLEAKMTLQHTLKLIAKPVVLSDDEVGEEAPPPEDTKNDIVPANTDDEQKKLRAVEKAINPDSLIKAPDSTAKTLKVTTIADSVTKKTTLADSTLKLLKTNTPPEPSDTLRTRTIKAFHNVKVYKTNLQAKADSLFYAAADSTLRFYQNPIVWSDSTQQTGDTIHVQFKNKKMNSAQIFQNAFIANQVSDSTKFNQMKGKMITVFFKEGEVQDAYVDGNAESIYYDKKTDGQYQFNQTISARIKITFEDKEIRFVKEVKGVEGVFSTKEAEKQNILTGFVWKPEIRPKSKDDVIGPPATVPAKSAAAAAKSKPNNAASKKPAPAKTGQTTSGQTKPNRPLSEKPNPREQNVQRGGETADSSRVKDKAKTMPIGPIKKQ